MKRLIKASEYGRYDEASYRDNPITEKPEVGQCVVYKDNDSPNGYSVGCITETFPKRDILYVDNGDTIGVKDIREFISEADYQRMKPKFGPKRGLGHSAVSSAKETSTEERRRLMDLYEAITNMDDDQVIELFGITKSESIANLNQKLMEI